MPDSIPTHAVPFHLFINMQRDTPTDVGFANGKRINQSWPFVFSMKQ